MRVPEAAKKLIRVFRVVTAPLDWLEFAAFVVVALGVTILIVWTFGVAFIDEVRRGDWVRATISLIPLLLLTSAVIRSVISKSVHWILIVFMVIVSAFAFYLLYW
jgi:hypothetical protein